ncbi:MAG: hypothetical protein IT361_07750 [Gemmatimonadaceae bacterium]|nr:hypothetical protein [Gemmatimonadaceae bacterium]
MRSRLTFLALAIVATSASAGAQSQPAAPKHEMQHANSAWKEMDAFHTVLAATYHPASGKKDLKPLRARADSLAATARSWSASTPPRTCAAASVRSTVADISTDALAIANQVLANATDAELLKAIGALHTKFERVEKQCGSHDMKGMKH